MEWWEFTQDNGDGSYSKLRFRTEEEANAALDWLQNHSRHWCGDGDGVSHINTESGYFFDTLEDIKDIS
jgi:hypothetical protein